jgi:hypothetical protein
MTTLVFSIDGIPRQVTMFYTRAEAEQFKAGLGDTTEYWDRVDLLPTTTPTALRASIGKADAPVPTIPGDTRS